MSLTLYHFPWGVLIHFHLEFSPCTAHREGRWYIEGFFLLSFKHGVSVSFIPNAIVCVGEGVHLFMSHKELTVDRCSGLMLGQTECEEP